MDVNLAQRSDRDEFVFLPSANDQNLSGTSIEFPSVYDPARVPLNHINNLIVAMTVEHRTTAYLRNHHEHRNAEAAGSRADKFIRRAYKREVSLMDRFHTDWRDWTDARMQNLAGTCPVGADAQVGWHGSAFVGMAGRISPATYNRFMCGRYQRRSDKQRIAEAFAIGNLDGLVLELTPDHNVAPQTIQPVIVWDERFGTRTLHMMFWRFLPRYVTDPKQFKLSTINAKSETLLSNKMWQESFLKRRCLVPVDTFLEWRKEGKRRLPYVFAMKDDQPFALGGVWRHWRSPDRKNDMDTFAIITVEPNELVAETTGHDRMPLIVARKDWQRWLELGNPERPPVDLLRPFDADQMKAWRVGERINNVKNNDPALSEPVRDEEDGQLGMFGD